MYIYIYMVKYKIVFTRNSRSETKDVTQKKNINTKLSHNCLQHLGYLLPIN